LIRGDALRGARPAVAEQDFDIRLHVPIRGQSGIHSNQFQEGKKAPSEGQISPLEVQLFVEKSGQQRLFGR
jgi:hypothetical protein